MAPTGNTPTISLPSLVSVFRLILELPNPFPSVNSLVITNIPVAVLLYATYSYYMDFMASRVADLRKGGVEDVFDFIVVGGGSAGAVVANKLSKDYNVLLLEAGGDPHPLSGFPTTSLVTLNLPLIDWGFKTVPQRHACFALKGNISQWPRGMALGGSSVQNIMMFMRGNPVDFDNWGKTIGSDEWSYDSLLPYFKRLEDYDGQGNDSNYHGKNGPLHVEKLRFAPGLEYWLEAGKELGYNIVDPNAYQRIGFGGMDVSMKKGVRFTTYMGYLIGIMDRKNLTIYRYARALKVHLDDTNTAYGVTYYRHGLTKFARATKEVILSAGSVMTPVLLMHSGIGPEDNLIQHGVQPKLNLPVGQNLQDHIFAVVGPFLLNQTVSYVLDRDTNLKTLIDYFSNGTGPIVSISGISGFGLFASSLSQNNYPDVYLNFVGVGVHSTFGKDLDDVFNFKDSTMQRFYAPYVGSDAFFFVVNLARSKSVGEIKLQSNDQFEHPHINPNYLSDRHDVQTMLDGITKHSRFQTTILQHNAKMGLKIFENTTAFGKLGTRLVPTKLPGCEEYELRSESYWECYIRHYTLTIYHPCCTARAGTVNDPRAVVDSQLRVIGTKNLRVVDASIMPDITNTNLNAPTIMIGEKGSDIILKHWQKSR